MEIFEMRYFLGVAKFENIHKASEKLHVSPGSLSKTVTRLESELGVKLFTREGRNIKLTSHGKLLQQRAVQIVSLEEAAQQEVSGHKGTIQVRIAGPEILLSQMGLTLAAQVKARHPLSVFEFYAVDEQVSLSQVLRGDAHMAVITTDQNLGLATKFLAEVKFQTYVGRGHKLFTAAQAKKTISVEEILKHPFVSPNNPILGKVGIKQSLDGWRDDEFPRKVEYLTSSLTLLERLVVSGKALAYLPDYYGNRLDLSVIKVSGCPYTCVQKVRLVAKNPKEIGWLNDIF